MYNSKIKDLIKKAKNKRIGAIPVGLRVSFGGVKVSVEAQYEISGKVVIYIIGDGKNTVTSIDGSVSNKTSAKNMLYNYVINNTSVKDLNANYTKYNSSYNSRNIKLTPEKRLKEDTSKFVDELFIEVNVANVKSKYDVSPNMAIKNKVAANRKPGSKKPVAKKTIAKKTVAKKTVAKKKATSSTGQKAYKYVYSKKKGSLVYAGTIKK